MTTKNPHTQTKILNHRAIVSVRNTPIRLEAMRDKKPTIQRCVSGIFVCQGLPWISSKKLAATPPLKKSCKRIHRSLSKWIKGADVLPMMANAKMHDVVGKWRSLRYSLKARDAPTFYFLRCLISVFPVEIPDYTFQIDSILPALDRR